MNRTNVKWHEVSFKGIKLSLRCLDCTLSHNPVNTFLKILSKKSPKISKSKGDSVKKFFPNLISGGLSRMASKPQILHTKHSQSIRKTFQTSKHRRDTSPPADQAFTSFVPCASKTVTTERYVSFEFLREDGFTIGENLIAIGLEKLCS